MTNFVSTILEKDVERILLLLDDGRRWTQGATARDHNDEPTDFDGADACQWCVLGAAARVKVHHSTFSALLRINGAKWNDSATCFAEVRAGLLKLVAKQKAHL